MKAFFDTIRAAFGPLNQQQVDGFTVLYNASRDLPVRHQAYLIATAWHETAHTMQPIHERGKVSYFDKYEPGTKIGKALGNVLKGDGYKFRGRGYVQITGRRNYAMASKKIGVDLLADPEKALVPETAARIIVKGMVEGWFTTKKMADCADYQEMRRVVNGVDKSALIAEYATVIEKALMVEAVTETSAPQVPPVVVPKQPPSIQKAMLWIVGAIIALVLSWLKFGG